jgi:hypothetical protein
MLKTPEPTTNAAHQIPFGAITRALKIVSDKYVVKKHTKSDITAYKKLCFRGNISSRMTRGGELGENSVSTPIARRFSRAGPWSSGSHSRE